MAVNFSPKKNSWNQLFSNFFSKTVAFTKFLSKKSVRERLSIITTLWLSTVWKLRNFTATIFSQKFRESNFLLINFTINWFDEKNLYGSEFLVFPHCEILVFGVSRIISTWLKSIKSFQIDSTWVEVRLEIDLVKNSLKLNFFRQINDK